MLSPRVVAVAVWIILGMPLPTLHAAAVPAGGLDQRITIDVRDSPLTTFLDTLSAQAEVNFIIRESMDKERITATLSNVSIREALDLLLKGRGLRYRRLAGSNTFIVERLNGSAEAPFQCESLPKSRVTIDVSQSPLDSVLHKMGEQAKAAFVLAPGVGKQRVTARLRNVSVAEALAVLLEIKSLSCKRDAKTGAFLIGF